MSSARPRPSAIGLPIRAGAATVHTDKGKDTIDRRDVEDAILDAIVESRSLPAEFDRFLDEVADTWRDLSPVGTGEYRRGIKTESYGARLTKAGLRKGIPVGRVYHAGDLEKAWAIEAGTEDTPAFRPMMRTYTRFMT